MGVRQAKGTVGNPSKVVRDSKGRYKILRGSRNRKVTVTLSFRKTLFCAARLKGLVTREWTLMEKREQRRIYNVLRQAENILKHKKVVSNER